MQLGDNHDNEKHNKLCVAFVRSYHPDSSKEKDINDAEIEVVVYDAKGDPRTFVLKGSTGDTPNNDNGDDLTTCFNRDGHHYYGSQKTCLYVPAQYWHGASNTNNSNSNKKLGNLTLWPISNNDDSKVNDTDGESTPLLRNSSTSSHNSNTNKNGFGSTGTSAMTPSGGRFLLFKINVSNRSFLASE